jgi:hypothetical protein
MENIKSYERFSDFVGENWDTDEQKSCMMSETAKDKMKKLCEEHLIREAKECHNNMNENHTYEGYVKECQMAMVEMLGQHGYSTISKELAD